MSKVALILDQFGASKVDVIKILRSGLGLEISRIIQLAGSGNPLFVKRLFDRAEPTFAVSLQTVLDKLEKLDVRYRAYEVLDTQEFSGIDPAKLYQLNSERLRNMIAAREASIEQQIALGTAQDSSGAGSPAAESGLEEGRRNPRSDLG